MADKKKVLIISYVVPYPAIDGGQINIFGTVNYLRKFYDITLVFKIGKEKYVNDVEKLKALWPEVTIKAVAVFEKRSRKYTILLNLYKPLLKLKEKAKQLSGDGSGGSVTGKMEYFPFLPQDQPLLDALEQLFREENFEIIQVEHTILLSLIHILPDKAKKIFVQIENQYAILEDYFGKPDDRSLYGRYLVETAKFIEIELMRKYDCIFALTQKDKDDLSRFLPEQNFAVAPFPVLNSLLVHEPAVNKQKPERLVYLGSQAHPPNKDAVEWFSSKMADEVFEKFGIRLYVTGHWENWFREKHANVIYTGFIDDVAELMKNSISISPIRLGGGGIRAKMLQSMAMRAPLVSTSVSSEGVSLIKDHENILIANTASEFITAIGELVADNHLYNKISRNAFELVKMHFSEEAVGSMRQKIYEQILRS